MPGQDGENSRTQPQEPRSNGANGPSAHALNALRAALDYPARSKSPHQHQHLQQPQNSGSHASAVHRDHSTWSQNNNFRHAYDEQLPTKISPFPMRASYSATPLHNSTSGAPLRATVGGHADLQRLDFSTRASPTTQRFSPPLAPPVQRCEARAEMLQDVDTLVTDDPVISDMPSLMAPASTPTLRSAPCPPSDKSARAAERRAQFMQQQQRGGQGTAPSSNAGSVRAPESSSLDELRKRQAGIPTTAQRGPESSSMTELLGRQQVPFCPTLSDSVPESRRRVERRSARALAPSA
jgi:hypothetical protein